MMDTKDTKAVYKRMIDEAFNAGDLKVVDEVVSPNYVLHGAPPDMPQGPDAIRATVKTFRTAFPDLKIELKDLVAEGDKVSARSVMRGTHEGMLFGIPATHKKVEVDGLTMVTVCDGRVQESWVKNDTMQLFQQLGVSPPKM
jgi:steroid delta-isomerase-like uncharacterized protein